MKFLLLLILESGELSSNIPLIGEDDLISLTDTTDLKFSICFN